MLTKYAQENTFAALQRKQDYREELKRVRVVIPPLYD
jgi:hypothetical protein